MHFSFVSISLKRRLLGNFDFVFFKCFPYTEYKDDETKSKTIKQTIVYANNIYNMDAYDIY